jgi:hypothetical protein
MAVPVFIFFYAVFVNTGKADLSESVLVPGISAGSVVLNSTVDSVLKAFSGEAYRKVLLRGPQGLFRQVFSLDMQFDIPFNEIYSFQERSLAVFCMDRYIRAVVVTNAKSVTSDGIHLNKGISLLIFTYGNSGLVVKKRDKHVLYCYPERGIAFFDDGGNDSIDMTAVFKLQARERTRDDSK